MNNKDYKRAEALAAAAEAFERRGRHDKARSAYAAASLAQEAALESFPLEKKKTRGILAVNAVALAFRAKDHSRAEALACRWLGERSLPAFACTQLREFLEVIWDEQALATAGYEYTGESVMISLRGGHVGKGTAPTDDVLDSLQRLLNLLTRIVEYLGKAPYRVRGSAPAWVKDLFVARVSQPQIGSYRFILQISRPLRQAELFEQAPAIDPERVTELFVRLPRLATTDSEEVKVIIPEPEYRDALLKLTRNIVPDGRRIQQIELARMSDRLATDTRERALLLPEAKSALNKLINEQASGALSDDDNSIPDVIGTLRGLHLDKHWLEVQTENGETIHYETGENALDDVIGPMVNRRVRVLVSRKKGIAKLIVRDIRLESDE